MLLVNDLINFYRKDEEVRFVFWTFLFSLFIHFLLMFVNYEFLPNAIPSSKKNIERIKISLRDSKQIVTTQKRKEFSKPRQSKFLSEFSNAVSRETISKRVGSYKEGGKSSSVLSLNDLSVKSFKGRKKVVIKKKVKLQAGGKKEGFSQNNDYIENIPLGDVTKLNSTRYKYYGFYNRIKKQLEQYWGTSIENKMKRLYSTGRRLASGENRITSLSIKLNEKGDIMEVSIKSTSGIKELDAAAVEAFNKAGPFPNPPKGMLIKNEAVIEWGFVVRS